MCVAHMIFDHVPAWMMVHGTLYAFANEGFEAAHKRNKQLFNKGDRGGGKYGSLDGVIKNIFLKLYRTQLLVWAQDNLDEEEAEAFFEALDWDEERQDKACEEAYVLYYNGKATNNPAWTDENLKHA